MIDDAYDADAEHAETLADMAKEERGWVWRCDECGRVCPSELCLWSHLCGDDPDDDLGGWDDDCY